MSPDRYWAGKRWVLVELKGVPVQLSDTRRDAYIEFYDNNKTFGGNGGCNQVSGNYVLDGSRLAFVDVISTKMACADIAFENTFLETLARVDRYDLKNEDLILKDGRSVVMILQERRR